TSPPPLYNFREIPVVASVDPLWDDVSPFERDRPSWMERLADPDQPAREVVDTSTVYGEPEAVVRLPGASPWPIATTVALAIALIGVLGGWNWLAFMGASLVALTAVAWAAA